MAHQIAFMRECVSIRLHVAVLLSEDVDVLVTFASIPAALVIVRRHGGSSVFSFYFCRRDGLANLLPSFLNFIKNNRGPSPAPGRPRSTVAGI